MVVNCEVSEVKVVDQEGVCLSTIQSILVTDDRH